MSDKAKAMERLIQSVVTGEKLRTATNAELADLMREHVWAGLMMCSAVADLVGEAMDRLRGLKTCGSCHGWGHVAHVQCATCDGTGDVEPRARETDGAVREAAAKLNATGEEMARLDENNVADSFAALHVLAPRFIREAKALLSALSSPPRPATKDTVMAPSMFGAGLLVPTRPMAVTDAPPADAATEAVREAADHLIGLTLEFCNGDCEDPEHAAARALRTALSSPPRPDFIRCALPRGECCHQRIPPVLPLEAPECNDGDDCCRYCGRGLQPCGACKPPAPPADAAPSLDALALEADNFARTTFPSRSAESISEHLRREAVELAAAPNDAEEMADVFILLGNLVHFTGTDLNAAVVAKLAKNRARKWGKPDAHGVVEHLRETPPADAATEAVREAAERLLEDYEGVEDMLLPDTAGKVLRLRTALAARRGDV